MNIFLLDYDPFRAARAHCDIHVNSQIREACQMLSTAYRMLEGTSTRMMYTSSKGNSMMQDKLLLPQFGEHAEMDREDAVIYWDCYNNHPCNKWVRASRENYLFLVELLDALNRQWIHRSSHSNPHGAWLKNQAILRSPPPSLEATGITDFAQAMPEPYKHRDPVRAYRQYYVGEKSHLYCRRDRQGLIRWTGYDKGVEAPSWLVNSRESIGIKRT